MWLTNTTVWIQRVSYEPQTVDAHDKPDDISFLTLLDRSSDPRDADCLQLLGAASDRTTLGRPVSGRAGARQRGDGSGLPRPRRRAASPRRHQGFAPGDDRRA